MTEALPHILEKLYFSRIFPAVLRHLVCFATRHLHAGNKQENPLTFKHPAILYGSCLFVLLSLILSPLSASAKSRYVTLHYNNHETLRDFNENLELGRSLSRMVNRKNVVTAEDEVYAKVDFIIEKVEVVLDMFPKSLNFKIVIVPTARDVAAIYKKNYGKNVNHIAYYSLSQKTIYMSADDTSLRVLAHEIGHVIVDHFFQVRPPYNIHELMAQFAEKHVTD